MILKFFTVICFAIVSSSVQSAVSIDLDCMLKSYVIENICSDYKMKKRYSIVSNLTDLTNTAENKYWISNGHKFWWRKISSCATKKCINTQLDLRIGHLYELLSKNTLTSWVADKSIGYNCFGEKACKLLDRSPIGMFEGNMVYVDKVQVRNCFDECDDPYIEYNVYEVKEGKKDELTQWYGRFKKQKIRLDYKRKDLELDVRDIKVETIKFGYWPPTGEDDYFIILSVKRGESGWKPIGETEGILE